MALDSKAVPRVHARSMHTCSFIHSCVYVSTCRAPLQGQRGLGHFFSAKTWTDRWPFLHPPHEVSCSSNFIYFPLLLDALSPGREVMFSDEPALGTAQADVEIPVFLRGCLRL